LFRIYKKEILILFWAPVSVFHSRFRRGGELRSSRGADSPRKRCTQKAVGFKHTACGLRPKAKPYKIPIFATYEKPRNLPVFAAVFN
jgi:hypothetical protein